MCIVRASDVPFVFFAVRYLVCLVVALAVAGRLRVSAATAALYPQLCIYSLHESLHAITIRSQRLICHAPSFKIFIPQNEPKAESYIWPCG